jgi:hypothetical protein
MTTLTHKIAAEVKIRELLAEQGIPEPDTIEYGEDCVRLFWDGPKVVLVVDLESDDADADAPVHGEVPLDSM